MKVSAETGQAHFAEAQPAPLLDPLLCIPDDPDGLEVPDRSRFAFYVMASSVVTIYGVVAVTFMMIMYAREPRGRRFVKAG